MSRTATALACTTWATLLLLAGIDRLAHRHLTRLASGR